MIGAIVAGVVSSLLASRIERKVAPPPPPRPPSLTWNTQPWRRLR